MTDQRPRTSPMPDDAAAIGQALIDRLKPELDSAFAQVAALPGNPAERENDALSIIASLGGFVGLQLTGRLIATKRIDPETALTIACETMADRMCAEVAGVILGVGKER